MPKTIESVAILGGGFMGAGIAESAFIAGFPVLVRDSTFAVFLTLLTVRAGRL